MTGTTGSAALEAPSEPATTADGTYRLGWYTVYMTAAVAVMSQIDRGVLALFVQPMKRDFHLTDTQVSFLLGFAFTFFYVVGGPPLSRIADRGVRRTLIASCLAVWSVATAFCGVAQNFWAFFLARAVIGGSESGCGPACLSMIADAVPRKRLPLAYAIYNSGFTGGGALSLVIGGLLIGLLAHVEPIHLYGIVIYNWQLVFVVLGLPGLVISAIFLLTVPEPHRRGASKPEGYSLREVFAFVIGQRALHLPFLTGVLLLSFQLYGLGAWTPAFFERTYGWGPAVSGPLLGMIALISSMIGLFSGARLAEILGKRYEDANMRVYFLAQTMAIPFGVIGPLMPSPWLSLACIAIATACATMANPVFSAALNLTTPNQMRSQITALYFILANAIAGSLGPTLVALVTDYVARSESDLRYVISGFRLVLGPTAAFFIWKTLSPYRVLYRQRIAEGA